LNLSALLFNEETLFFSYNKSTAAAAAEIEKKRKEKPGWLRCTHPKSVELYSTPL
jgi:hypothetical protein